MAAPDQVWLLLGLLAVAYKTIRALRFRVTAALDVLALETQLANSTATAATDDESARKERTAKAAAKILDSETRTDMLLKWWTVFGLLHFTSAFGLPYLRELRSLLIIVGLLPLQWTFRWIEWVFVQVASPACGRLIPKLNRWVVGKGRVALSLVSPLVRGAVSAALSSPVLTYCPECTLARAEETLSGLSGSLTQERRKRRMRALRQGMPASLEHLQLHSPLHINARTVEGSEDAEEPSASSAAGAAAAGQSQEELSALLPHHKHYVLSPREYEAGFLEGGDDGSSVVVGGGGGPVIQDVWQADYLDDDEIALGSSVAGLGVATAPLAMTPKGETPMPPPGKRLTLRKKTPVVSTREAEGGSSESDEVPGAAVGGLVSSFSRGIMSALGSTPKHGGAGSSSSSNGGAAAGATLGSGRPPRPGSSRVAYRQSTGVMGSAAKGKGAVGARTILWTPQAAGGAAGTSGRSRYSLDARGDE